MKLDSGRAFRDELDEKDAIDTVSLSDANGLGGYAISVPLPSSDVDVPCTEEAWELLLVVSSTGECDAEERDVDAPPIPAEENGFLSLTSSYRAKDLVEERPSEGEGDSADCGSSRWTSACADFVGDEREIDPHYRQR